MRYVYIILSFLFSLPAMAQEHLQPILRNFSTEDGLPSSEVYDILQDSNGYMWFATDNGVAKYDGYEFKVVSTQEGLSDNTVFGLFEDHKGRVWFRTYSGRLSYFDAGSVFSPPINEDLSSAIKGSIVNSLYVDPNDTIWLGLSHGSKVMKVTPALEIIESTYENGTYAIDFGKSMLIAGTPNLKDEISSVRFSGPTMGILDTALVYPQSSSVGNYLAIKSKKGEYVFARNGLTCTLGPGAKQIISESNPSYRVISLYEDSNESIWVGQVQSGVRAFVIENGNVREKHHLLQSYSITKVLEDRDGGYWFSTLEKGVFYSPNLKFRSYATATRVVGFAELEDGMAFATTGGELKKITNDRVENWEVQNIPTQPKPMLWCLYELKNGHQLIGFSTATYICDDHGANVRSWEVGGSVVSEADDLWMGTKTTFVKLSGDPVEVNFKRDYGKAMPAEAILDRGDSLLIGNKNGLWRFDKIDGTLAKILMNGKSMGMRITGIKELDDGLAISTGSEGLVLQVRNKLISITADDGLISDKILGLEVVGNEIWAFSKSGISIVKISGEGALQGIQNLSIANGLISNEVSNLYHAGNEVWVAAASGISVFPLEEIKASPKIPVIREFAAVHDGTILEDSSQLGYGVSGLVISYTAISYGNREGLVYRYKLHSSEEWKETKRRKLELPHLSPGDYTFSLQASVDGKTWSDRKTLFFRVLPPFWQKWWFYTLLSLSGMILLIAFRVAKKRVKKRLIQRRTELQALKAQASEAKMANTSDEDSGDQSTQKLKLQDAKGTKVVCLLEIVRCESDNNYTHFYFADSSTLLISKTLKNYEEQLSEKGFYRTHNSHLINLAHLVEYTNENGGTVIMTDGSSLPVSRRRKAGLLKRLE